MVDGDEWKWMSLKRIARQECLEDDNDESVKVGSRILEHLPEITNADRIQDTDEATAECGKEGGFPLHHDGGFVPARAGQQTNVGEATRVAMATATEGSR